MALFINGVGQDSFSMNGVSIDNLYVDSVLVWSSFFFSMTVTAPTQPIVNANTQPVPIVEDNGDGTWHVYSNGAVTQLYFLTYDTTAIVFHSAKDLVNVSNAFDNQVDLEYVDLRAVDTSQFTNVEYMFRNSSVLKCISNLDTTNSVSNVGIFDGCDLLSRPNAEERDALESAEGFTWVNDEDCPGINFPVITILGDNPVTIQVNDTYVDAGATATDVEDGDLTSSIITTNNVDDTTIGNYTVEYSVTDSDENTTVANRTVVVEELTIPRYEMTVPLVNDGTFDYVDDDKHGLSDYDGKLTESDGTTPYLPTTGVDGEYPQDGTLLLENGRIMDTQYTMSTQEAVYQVYDVVKGTSYKIVALEPVSEGIINVWEGDQDTPLSKTQSDKAFALPLDSWKIEDGIPSWAGQSLDTGIGLVRGNGSRAYSTTSISRFNIEVGDIVEVKTTTNFPDTGVVEATLVGRTVASGATNRWWIARDGINSYYFQAPTQSFLFPFTHTDGDLIKLELKADGYYINEVKMNSDATPILDPSTTSYGTFGYFADATNSGNSDGNSGSCEILYANVCGVEFLFDEGSGTTSTDSWGGTVELVNVDWIEG